MTCKVVGGGRIEQGKGNRTGQWTGCGQWFSVGRQWTQTCAKDGVLLLVPAPVVVVVVVVSGSRSVPTSSSSVDRSNKDCPMTVPSRSPDSQVEMVV